MRKISMTELFPYFDEFSGSNWVQIWIHLFQEDLFPRSPIYPEI